MYDEEIYPVSLGYTVWHKGSYYVGDKEGWNYTEYIRFNDAMAEYYSLLSIGFTEDEVYLKDENYGITFSHDEWT